MECYLYGELYLSKVSINAVPAARNYIFIIYVQNKSLKRIFENTMELLDSEMDENSKLIIQKIKS